MVKTNSNTERSFVISLLKFARGLCMANGAIGIIATTLSFFYASLTTAILFFAGTLILLGAAALLSYKLHSILQVK